MTDLEGRELVLHAACERARDAEVLDVAQEMFYADLLHFLSANFARHVLKRLGRRRAILKAVGLTKRKRRSSECDGGEGGDKAVGSAKCVIEVVAAQITVNHGTVRCKL